MMGFCFARARMVIVFLAMLIVEMSAEESCNADTCLLEDMPFTSQLQYSVSTSLGEDVRSPPVRPHSPPQAPALIQETQPGEDDSYVAGACRQSEFSFEAAQVRGPVEVVLAIDEESLAAPALAVVQSADQCASWPAKLRYWVFCLGDEVAAALCRKLGRALATAGVGGAEYCNHYFPSGASLIVARPPKAAVSTAMQISSMIPGSMLAINGDRSDPQNGVRLRSFANHLRFAIDRLLPSSSETAMYMDVDTLVRGDLLKVVVEAQGRYENKTLLMADRWPIILDECLQAKNEHPNHTLQEIGINNMTYAAQHFKPAELKSTEYNAGFMLFNLRFWRNGEAMRRFMDLISVDQRYSLCEGGNQCPLNLAFVGEHAQELGVLDRSWNCDGFGHKSEQCCPDPDACDVMHWTGHKKPWHLDANYHGMWRDHLQRVEQLVDNRSRKKFVVLTQQRSGSGYLVSMLGSHRLATAGQEMLGNPPFRFSGKNNVADWSTRKPLLDSWFAIPRSSVATGFKIMMNQLPLMEEVEHGKAKKLIEYLGSKDVLFVILWRRNVLRQYISKMANINVHKTLNSSNAHPDSLSGKALAQTAVELPVQRILIELRRLVHERLELESLLQGTQTANKVHRVFYEDLVASEFGDRKEWTSLQAFLGLPERALRTSLVAIHNDVPMCQSVTNWDSVVDALSRTEFGEFLEACPVHEEIPQPPIPRILVYKRARTGSTWLADMLSREPEVAWFIHEVQGCAETPDDLQRVLLSLVQRPSCGSGEAGSSKCGGLYAERSALSRNDTCLTSSQGTPRAVGFTINMEHDPMVPWAGHVKLLSQPHVHVVQLVRTNLVRHFASQVAAHDLDKYCGSKKILTPERQACAESLPTSFQIDARELIAASYKVADYSRHEYAMLRSVGKIVLRVTYESLSADPRSAINLILRSAGLQGNQNPVQTTSKKHVTKSLREVFKNFEEVEEMLLAGNHTCLLAQLRESEPASYELCESPDGF
eukprot:TRINITY_DN12476_c0_g1_i1.p1 TRINITY_DN12476_c0_g1~~TRINITY_DN12476_c0_g1_i1.p1  ORF type:complete len:993 (-),score=114.06 TRINITY_DN12476_c0_g1_i1:162-3140(-)